MKTPGIVRKIDEAGRIVIPTELRKALNLQSDDLLELQCRGDAIVLRKYAPACVFCGGQDGLSVFEEKYICSHCLRNLRKV